MKYMPGLPLRHERAAYAAYAYTAYAGKYHVHPLKIAK